MPSYARVCSFFRRFGAKPRKKRRGRVHGRRLSLQPGWLGSGRRSVLGCAPRGLGGEGLAKIADTLSEHRAIGRSSQVCERWIYTCVCFALDFDEQKRSGFRYQYSNYQIEYSRNVVFEVGGRMDQVFQALIDRSRAPLDLKTIKT
jgi:hypothetical protein